MVENKVQENADCKTAQHSRHLCHLMHDGFHFDHRAEYKEMVQNAQFRCQFCGRTAKNDTSLCSPVAL